MLSVTQRRELRAVAGTKCAMNATNANLAMSLAASGWRAAAIADPDGAPIDWNSWLETLTTNPESLAGYRQLKQGGCTNVFVTKLSPNLAVVVKHTQRSGIVTRLARLIRPSAEAHECRLGLALSEAGVPTPRPLALFERTGHSCDSLMITRFIDQLRDLDQVVMVELPRRKGPHLPRLKRDLAAQLAKTIADFHRAGFTHRDLKASNILVQLPTEAGSAPSVWLVDLKGVSRRMGSAATQLRALTRLAASLLTYRALTRTDYARFLSNYLSHMGLDRREWLKLYPTLARDAHHYNRRAKSRKAGKIDGYGGA